MTNTLFHPTSADALPTSRPTAPKTTTHPIPSSAAADDAPADIAALKRLERSFDKIDALTSLLADEPGYTMPPVTYAVPKSFKLSVVIPVFNEAATIRRILARVAALPLPIEIIVVDDCSTDGTREILQRLERSPLFTIFYKPKNEGKGAALRTGFSLATGDVIVVQDADLEYDPRDIPPLLEPILQARADVVFGSRFLTETPPDRSFIHRLGNRLLTRASNAFTGLRITDMETCYKAFRRSDLQSIRIKQKRFGFEPEITAKLARRKLRFQEVPISYQARSYAEGKKIGLRDLFNALYCIVRYGLCD